MREIRPSGSEGGGAFKPLSLPLSQFQLHSCGISRPLESAPPGAELQQGKAN